MVITIIVVIVIIIVIEVFSFSYIVWKDEFTKPIITILSCNFYRIVSGHIVSMYYQAHGESKIVWLCYTPGFKQKSTGKNKPVFLTMWLEFLEAWLALTSIETYRIFSRDVTAAMLVFLNKGAAAVLVSPTNPLRIELYSNSKAFFCFGWKAC